MIPRIASAVKSFKQARRKKHLLKVVGRGLAKQKNLIAKRAARKVKIDQLRKKKPWSTRKKTVFGLGVGGAGVGYIGYKSQQPKYEEY